MIIRQEHPSDHNTVYQIIKSAFEHAEHSDGNEQEPAAIHDGSIWKGKAEKYWAN